MSKDTAPSELNLSAEINELAKTLKERFVIDDEGLISPEKGLYEDLLPTGLTMANVKALQAHNTNLVAATAHAVADLGQNFLKKHGKIERVRLDKFHAGKDIIRADYQRSTTVSSPNGTKTEKFGWITAKYTAASAGSNSGAYGRIRAHFAEAGAKAFSS